MLPGCNILNRADTATGSEEWTAIQRAIHRLSENSHLSTVDSQGRVTIPGWLLEKAGIGKDALVIGAVDRVSIWEPGRYAVWAHSDGDNIGDTGVFV